MVASYRPDLYLGVAFNADPNSTDTPTWTDLTARLRHADGVKRGRQYELDQNQAGQPTMVLWDPDEYLNPGNTSAPAPYAGNIVPYRQILMQAVWPNPCAGNLLNTKAVPTGYDPAFETTAVGGTPPNLLTYATSPTVVAANPWQGTKSLQWSVTGNSSEQVAGFTIPCIPGRQYTASVYYRQTAANTGALFVNGGPGSTTTTATGTYVRLVVTFTASQPTHQLFVGSFSPTLASTVNVDAFQLEQGSTASAFTTSGSVIYPVLRDYVERWPSSWDPNSAGFAGLAEITCVDALAVLQGVNLHTEYRSSILAKNPDYYWTLGEPSGATTFGETSGNSGPSLVRIDSQYGPAKTFQAGTQTNVVGDPGGTGLQTAADLAAASPPISVAATGRPTNPISIGSSTLPFSFTVAMWLNHGKDPILNGNIALRNFLAIDDASQNNTYAHWYVYQGNPNTLVFDSLIGGIGGGLSTTDLWDDGTPHLLIMVVTLTSSGLTNTVYVDGNQILTNTATPPFYNPVMPAAQVQVGGWIQDNSSGGADTYAGAAGGIYSHLAIWNRALSASEVTDLWNAGRWGYLNEGSGRRIQRYLTGTYNGSTVLDAGQSLMGISNLAENTTLLDACQSVTTSENGNLWVDGNGVLQFAGRTRRYLATTSKYTFGENTAAGEIPYAGDIKFNFDPTYVYNDVTVTRTGGVVAHVNDAPSQRKYFKRGYQRTIDVASDLETIDAANWLLNTHKAPSQRVERITLDPVGYPAAWPVVLGLEIGTRVTVKRRTSAANGGAGLTMSADFFVESIEHSGIDMDAGTWTTTLLLSPAVGYQVGIFDDATYGRFDQTLIFGY